MGSVFSPYYAWARRGGNAAQPAADNHCALNVALYSRQAKRWAMTERGQRHCSRSAVEFNIGPSQLQWDGRSLIIHIDEVCMPIPYRIKGRIRLEPRQLFNFSTPLDGAGKHRWGPLAPHARIDVDLQHPAQRWKGHAYLDSNEGDEPIANAFTEWDWSRSQMKDGSTAVLYDVEPETRAQRGQAASPASAGKVLALRFQPNGEVTPFEPPPTQHLRRTLWGINRRMRSDGPVEVSQQLEDTPFYQRAVLQSTLLGETVSSFHETLNVPRLVSPVVQAMLPWRMPRRG